MKNAYFAGGCFWCITPVFLDKEGVKEVISGYSGGDEIDPSYEQVKSQTTGHREAIRIEYDEEKFSYEQLLEIFLENVDPFDEGGQFMDRGRSYTLAVFYNNDQEKEIAERRLKELADKAGQKVYISLEPYKNFYDAEEYHQRFFEKNPERFAKELKERADYKG